jgi:hypothetical protein
MYMTSLIAYFGYEIKQINGPITWVQTRIRKRPQPAPMLGYGLIKRPKLGLSRDTRSDGRATGEEADQEFATVRY